MSTHAERSSAPRGRARRGALPPPQGSDDSLAPELDEDGTAEGAQMSSRYTFDPSVVHALRIRGLTVSEWARRGGVVIATASSAVHGHEVNLTTAWRLTRVLDAAPVVPALERWALLPGSPQQPPKRGSRISQARRGATDLHPGLVPRRLGRGVTDTGMRVTGGTAGRGVSAASRRPRATPPDPTDAPAPPIRPAGSARPTAGGDVASRDGDRRGSH
jgi:hypothetical protein